MAPRRLTNLQSAGLAKARSYVGRRSSIRIWTLARRRRVRDPFAAAASTFVWGRLGGAPGLSLVKEPAGLFLGKRPLA